MNQNRHHNKKKILELRAKILTSIRGYFENKGYLEVETPIRIPAPAPEATIDAQSSGSWFLHTSPELCMKRLLADGFERIFQICKCFRKEERGRLHLPEMTMLEWYTAGHDYLDMMQQCEDLITFVALGICHAKVIQYQGHKIDLAQSWHRMTVKEAFEIYAPVSLSTAIENGMFDEIIACDIAPHLGLEKPVFLFDYPATLGSLARLKQTDDRVAERFELYIAGIEICNAFSELTDPAEQRKRFNVELNMRRLSQKTVYPLPEPFLEALNNMPDAAGNALGIDRLIMLFADTAHIDAVVTFTPETS
jgi:elongation factor P--(R)-beta-lysine ligase